MHKEERLSCSVCRQDYWSLDALQRHRKEYNHFLSKSYYHDSPSSPIAEDKPEPFYENISSEEDNMNDDIDQSSEKDYFQAPGLQSLLMIDSHNHLQQICDVRRGISKDTLLGLLSESWKLGFDLKKFYDPQKIHQNLKIERFGDFLGVLNSLSFFSQ